MDHISLVLGMSGVVMLALAILTNLMDDTAPELSMEEGLRLMLVGTTAGLVVAAIMVEILS